VSARRDIERRKMRIKAWKSIEGQMREADRGA